MSGEQRFVLYGVPWQTYVRLRDELDTPGLRMTFCEGTLELIRPSIDHESAKKTIARLIEIFALERDVPLYGYGSTTFRREAKARGLDPDECYCVGEALKEFPDIAIEVMLTSRGIDKLSVLQRSRRPRGLVLGARRIPNPRIARRGVRVHRGQRAAPGSESRRARAFRALAGSARGGQGVPRLAAGRRLSPLPRRRAPFTPPRSPERAARP
ncbi:Uma2 family endonuclease [Sorangium sp. So ce134]